MGCFLPTENTQNIASKGAETIKTADSKNPEEAESENYSFLIQKKKKIHDYVIINLLGKGQFGKVFLVESSIKQKFAAKAIEVDPRDKESARQEALILCKLKHQNIVKVKEFFFYDTEKFLVVILEYCSRGTLAENIENIHLDKVHLRKLLIELAEGVQFLHQNRVVHRDLKPENIFLDHAEHIKIGDLGLAQILTTTLLSKPAGTRYYMALEMLQSNKYSFEVDIWALGIIFLEMMVGLRIYTILDGKDLPCHRAEFPSKTAMNEIDNIQYRELLKKMLNKDPQKRITIDQVLSELDGRPLKNKSGQKGNKIVKSDGYYEGQIVDGKMQGKGIFYWTSGDKYEGQFKRDKQNGRGVKDWMSGPNKGDRYEGEYVDNIKSGRGVYTYSNGQKYDGEWINDQPHGRGIFYQKNGNKYDGQWLNGSKNGRGARYWNDGPQKGDKYDGQYLNNLKHGKGIYQSNNGQKYEGEFKSDLADGKGVYYLLSGEIYDGEFKLGLRHGEGIWIKQGKKYKVLHKMGEFVEKTKI